VQESVTSPDRLPAFPDAGAISGNDTALQARVALDLPPTDDLLLRLRGLLGKPISDDLLEIYYGGVNLAIRGYIGKPQLSRSNRSLQYFFVNGRPINSHVLSYAIKQAYHSLIPKERHPVFAVFFELDPSMVDVNCHPRKTEVKFRDEREVYRVLLQSCGKALEKAVLTPKVTMDNLNYYQEKLPQGLGGRVAQAEFQALAGRETVQVTLNDATVSTNSTPGPQLPAAETPSSGLLRESGEQSSAASPADNLQQELIPLGQLDLSFILCQRGHDLVIINKLISEVQSEEKAIQPLLMPISLEIPPADLAVLEANKAVLEEVGIGLEHFGGNTFAINEVPSYLVKTDLEKVLLGLIDDLKTLREHDGQRDELATHKGDLASRRERALTYLACRSAVKFGDHLGEAEIKALIDQLNLIPPGQMTCPHGRPIMIVLEKSELYSRFGRKYGGFFERENFRDVNC
jgi:DNA mismatch repair protein MutL